LKVKKRKAREKRSTKKKKKKLEKRETNQYPGLAMRVPEEKEAGLVGVLFCFAKAPSQKEKRRKEKKSWEAAGKKKKGQKEKGGAGGVKIKKGPWIPKDGRGTITKKQ